MRLRLAIQRNNLPPVKTLFAIDAAADPPPTISQLLGQINDQIPLEAGSWGLEDYVVTLGGYECLHYSKVLDIVQEDDELCIRPISTPENRARTLSGRYQINASGQHLTDGIPFGRQMIRTPNRPAIHIPPRKRRRVSIEHDATLLSEELDVDHDEHIKLLENGRAVDEDDGDSEEEDDDFVSGGSDEDEEDTEEDEEVDVDEQVQADDAAKEGGTSPTGRKRRRSVSFNKVVDVEKDSHSVLTGSSSSEADDSDESEDDSDSDSEISSSEDDSSDEESALPASKKSKTTTGALHHDDLSDVSSDDESSESSAEKQLKAESERKSQGLSLTKGTSGTNGVKDRLDSSLSAPWPPTNTVPTKETTTPPGEGARTTQKRNTRRRVRTRLLKLISIGELPAGANTADLQRYDEDRGHSSKRSSSVSNGASRESTESKISELELHRQRLLNQLLNGGVDVDTDMTEPAIESSNTLDVQSSVTDATASAGGIVRPNTSSPMLNSHLGKRKTKSDSIPKTVWQKPAETATDEATKRPRLNMGGSNRLIFGALGVRAPKTKDDGVKLRQKLAARSDLQRPESSGVAKAAALPEHETEAASTTTTTDNNVLSDDWKDMIVLKAVECIDEGVSLSEPPYPFVQCWDEQYVWNRPQDKKKRKKRNRQEQYTEDAVDEDYTEEWTEDMYDDDAGAKPEPKTHIRFNGKGEEEVLVENAGFPSRPSDFEELPVLAADYCNVGAYVVFKEMHVDASTKWQPEISDWQVARVDGKADEHGLKVTLAPEHRRTEQAEYDDKGRRIREGFEMPDSDDEAEERELVDDGVREITLESIIEIKLLRGADEYKTADVYSVASEDDHPTSSSEAPSTRKLGASSEPIVDSDIEWDGIGDEAEVESIGADVESLPNGSSGSSSALLADGVADDGVKVNALRAVVNPNVDIDPPFSTAAESKTEGGALLEATA